MHRKVDESGRADRDQHVGAQARGALPILPLGADQGAVSRKSVVWKVVRNRMLPA
jgi:hypothetical protein